VLSLTNELLDTLIKPGSRLPWIKKWLIEEVWTLPLYESFSHIEYLKDGEEKVNRFEELICSAGDRTYRELMSPPLPEKSLLNILKYGRGVKDYNSDYIS